MQDLQQTLVADIQQHIAHKYNVIIEASKIVFQQTRREFKGDTTLMCFPIASQLKQNPDTLATEIGTFLKDKRNSYVVGFNVVKGFLNLEIADTYFVNQFEILDTLQRFLPTNQTVVVEYASPNTNKPLHLGHVRNILLGYSMANILREAGNTVKKVQVINDRGIHICKSMLAWQQFSNGETPQNTGIKGDHLVGKYYVAFDQWYKKAIAQLIETGIDKTTAEKTAEPIVLAQQMLLKWEQNDPQTLELWQTMNGWVYQGFDETYKSLGIDFDKNYYESNTYLLGKSLVAEGLEKSVFYQKADQSVWIDLTADGLDEKLVLRADGTSVYITQDFGLAVERFNEFQMNAMIYTVGNEQDYHFKVLFLILKKLGYAFADKCFHLSYGMVELPEGKMKSREGTVVDADDLIALVKNEAKNEALERGKNNDLSPESQEQLFEMVGLGALKYFILKVDAKKKMLFNPKESVALQGDTAPFIQYTHARIKSLLRKGNFSFTTSQDIQFPDVVLGMLEKDLLKQLFQYKEKVLLASRDLNPSVLTQYAFGLAQTYNTFYQETPILKDGADGSKQNFRLILCYEVAQTIKKTMRLLGIEVPEKM